MLSEYQKEFFFDNDVDFSMLYTIEKMRKKAIENMKEAMMKDINIIRKEELTMKENTNSENVSLLISMNPKTIQKLSSLLLEFPAISMSEIIEKAIDKAFDDPNLKKKQVSPKIKNSSFNNLVSEALQVTTCLDTWAVIPRSRDRWALAILTDEPSLLRVVILRDVYLRITNIEILEGHDNTAVTILVTREKSSQDGSISSCAQSYTIRLREYSSIINADAGDMVARPATNSDEGIYIADLSAY